MDGLNRVRDAFDRAEDIPFDGGGPPDPPFSPEEIAPPIEAECALAPLNDYGNGQRFNRHFGEDSLFVPRVGWFRWSGAVWEQDEDRLKVRELAQQVAARILDEIPFLALEDWERNIADLAEAAQEELAPLSAKEVGDLTGKDRARMKELRRAVEAGEDVKKALASRKKSHRAHAKAAGNTHSINNMLTEAQVANAAAVSDMNADPRAINTLSGVIRFGEYEDKIAASFDQPAVRTWDYVLEPHNRDDLISKMIPVEVDPAATCPVFDAFLERILPRPEVRQFLKRWFGYSLTGLTVDQGLVFLHGGGRNGKSTLVDTIAEIMADYAVSIPIESLTGSEQRKGSDATPDLVRIPGARMVRASEPEQGTKMKEALIKALTGGEPILIRRMAQEFVEVKPEFKLTISGNHKPEIRGGDDGIWRRVMLVPFEEKITDEEVDKLLPEKLRAERSGILNWLLEGALEWFERGLEPPGVVLEAIQDYREQSDPLRTFFRDECEITGSAEDFTAAKDLVEAFQLYLEEAGNEPWGKRATSNQIRSRAGMQKHEKTGAVFTPHKRGTTGYLGIHLGPNMVAALAAKRHGFGGGYGE